MRVLALLLVLAPAANAQPLIGPEIRSAPFVAFGPAVAGPTAALGLANDGSGFIICWAAVAPSGHQRIFVARLNSEASIVSTTELPAFDPDADAYHPAIALGPAGALVAWVEFASAEPQGAVVALRVDAEGKVAGAPRQITGPAVAPLVTSDSGQYTVAAGTLIVTLSASGEPISGEGLPFAIDAFAAGASSVVISGHRTMSTNCGGGPLCNCVGSTPQSEYFVELIVRGGCSITNDDWFCGQVPQSGTAVAFDGRQYLLVWPDEFWHSRMALISAQCKAASPLAGAPAFDFATVSPQSNPQAVSDGTRFLIVYQTSSDIRVVVVTDGRPGVPIPIAGANARQPVVVAARPGRFLVAYRVDSSAGTQLAGRFIDFPEQRRRPSR